MVPTFTCGFVLSYFFLPIFSNLRSWLSAARLRDDLFRQVRRKSLVMVELHGVVGAALRHAAQLGRVPEHVAQRHLRLDHLGGGPRRHAEDVATAAGEVAHHVAHEVLGHGDLDLHDRLQQGRLGLAHAVLEAHRTGDLEGLLVGVDVVVRAVDQGDLDVDHREPGEDAVVHGVDDALLRRRDVLTRDGAADDLADELEALAHLVGLQLQFDVAVLPAAARLPDEAAGAVRPGAPGPGAGDPGAAPV